MKCGLYIHIPFCKQKCNYCDFASFSGQESYIDKYLSAVGKEAALRKGVACQTLYIGGGTPSLLSVTQLQKLGSLIEKYFMDISRFEESTFEANPESLTSFKTDTLRKMGFNRISIGLQSFHDDELQLLGRVHTASRFLTAYQAARKSGFENINVDLIAGLPGQTEERFIDSLKKLIDLQPQHISVYGLQIEEGTAFFKQGVACDQLLMRRILEKAQTVLKQAGYHHYEISNFAKPGYEARHNTHYWKNGEYIGLGSAAVSYQRGVRYQNTPSISEYISRIGQNLSPVVFTEKLTGKQKVGETLMLAFRRLDGVTLSPLQEKFFGKEIERHIQNGLLTRSNKKVKLTQEGIYLANEVFRSFVIPFENT